MLRVISDGLWAEIAELAANATPRLAAVAYVTSDEHVKFGEGDTLVCDATSAAIRFGKTSASALRRAFKRGARVYASSGLHAKVFVLGNVAVIGSANMSNASATQLNEVAVVTDDPRARAQARTFIERLVLTATLLDDASLRRLEAMPVVRSGGGSRRRAGVRLPTVRTWLVGLAPTGREHEDEDAFVDRERKAAAAERDPSATPGCAVPGAVP